MNENNEKLNILEVLDSFYPQLNGPCVLIDNYTKNLNKIANCDVMVPSWPKSVDNRPYKVIRVKSVRAPQGERLALPHISYAVKKAFKEKRYDIIHAHSPATLGMYIGSIGRKYHIPTVFTFHTKFDQDINRIVKNNVMRRIAFNYIVKALKNVDYVFAVSNDCINELRKYGYEGKVTITRNGTDMKYPDNAQELIDKVNSIHNLQGQQNVFLFVGRIVKTKNIPLALDALKIVKDKGVDFKMLIVGGGDYQDTIVQHINLLNLQDNVIFVGKVYDRQLLAGYYLRSDLFLFPSTYDTASLAPIEAAALKLPTLLIKDCATAETITSDVNGFQVEEDANKWADKIIEVINNPQHLREVSENCYKQVYRSWEMVADDILTKYKELIVDYNSKRANGRVKKHQLRHRPRHIKK